MTEAVAAAADSNAQPYSVSELAFALKRTLEDAYGFVRLRGEISKVTRHSNGHVYLTLKDERAAIDGVVWRTSVRMLKCRPEQGMEVIVTGKITTYPSGSRYQIVIETMEPAGVGALLAQLERLKTRLAAEGLFEAARKRPIPAMPAVVGVITSPTGAVIRDILHRLRDRWPCRVVVWPVVVQGEAAAAQVCAAINGFCAHGGEGRIPRPDVIIVARGGGSVEDLWPFNDETLARTVAACTIPLISAVGHETDTTLIDCVSDRRAPTPTAAAEMATPVLADLRAGLSDLAARMHRCGGRVVEDRKQKVASLGRTIGRARDTVELAAQRFGASSSRLTAALHRNQAGHERQLYVVASRLTRDILDRTHASAGERIAAAFERLKPTLERQLLQRQERLGGYASRLSAGLVRTVEAEQRDLARVAARLRPDLLARPTQLLEARLETSSKRLVDALDRKLATVSERLAANEKLLTSLDPERPLRSGFALVQAADGSVVTRGASLERGQEVTLKFQDRENARRAVIEGATSAPRVPVRPTRSARAKQAAADQGELF